MAELVAWGRGIHMGFDFNEEPMEVNDMDDQLAPIVKLPQACEYAQLLSKPAMEHPSEFSVVDVINMQSFMHKLNKTSFSNRK